MHKKCMTIKLFQMMHSILENQDELKLSDEEARKVRDLKIRTKKDLIKDTADIDLLVVDIIAELHNEKMDLAQINKLIDKKYDLKKESMKKLTEAFAQVKKSLSAEQMKRVKIICRNDKSQESRGTACCK
jgi:hypothetical protein